MTMELLVSSILEICHQSFQIGILIFRLFVIPTPHLAKFYFEKMYDISIFTNIDLSKHITKYFPIYFRFLGYSFHSPVYLNPTDNKTILAGQSPKQHLRQRPVACRSLFILYVVDFPPIRLHMSIDHMRPVYFSFNWVSGYRTYQKAISPSKFDTEPRSAGGSVTRSRYAIYN